MSDLASFINARLDEDEDNIEGEIQLTLESLAIDGLPTTREKLLTPDPPEYLPEFPRRLREVTAKRSVMARHIDYGDQCIGCGPPIGDYEPGDCPELRTLAAVYSDHPDYRQEWKP